jgi:hypothetical protein
MMGFLRFSTSTFCTINALRLYTHWGELQILFSELSESRSRLQDNTTSTPPPPCLFIAQPTAASQKPTRRPSDDQSPGLQKEKADKSKRQTRATTVTGQKSTRRPSDEHHTIGAKGFSDANDSYDESKDEAASSKRKTTKRTRSSADNPPTVKGNALSQKKGRSLPWVQSDEASHHTPTKRLIRSTASVEHKTPPEAVTPKLNKGKKRPLGRLLATRVKRSKPRPNYVVERLSVGEDESDFTMEDEVYIQSG